MDLNGYMDGELDMICEDFFGNIDDLLDFSTDDEALGVTDSAAAVDGRQQVASLSATAALSNGGGGRATASSEANKIFPDINISDDWITKFLDLPVTAAISADALREEEDHLFQTLSPVSVLEEANNLSSSKSCIIVEKNGGGSSSSSNSSNSCLSPLGPTVMLVPGRARSKRPRRASRATAPIIPPAFEGPLAIPSNLPHGQEVLTMRKKMKNRHLAATAGGGSEEGVVGGRRCRHCGIQKTPQWRAGPTGPKTLCNACGVRYKSGRLFPEYRPAASPTYVPTLHSNSHKRVVEMRNKECMWKAAHGTPSPECPAAKNCDLIAYI